MRRFMTNAQCSVEESESSSTKWAGDSEDYWKMTFSLAFSGAPHVPFANRGHVLPKNHRTTVPVPVVFTMLFHPDYAQQMTNGGAPSKSEQNGDEPLILDEENKKTRRASYWLTDTGPLHKKSRGLASFVGDNGGTLHDGEASFAVTGPVEISPGEEGMLWQLSL
jgi:hypothetical protein